MRKVIKGKLYDTETARLVGSWENTCYVSDFNHYEERLYRKRTGEYFLYGEGNAASPYAKRISIGEWTGGERIQPMHYGDARQWAEDHLDEDEYMNEFKIADDMTHDLHMLIDETTWQKLVQKAVLEQSSVSEVAREIIETKLGIRKTK